MTRALRWLACSTVVLTVGIGATLAFAGSRHVTEPQVAAHISVRVGKAMPNCLPGGKRCEGQLRNVTLSFVARVGVANPGSWYQFNTLDTPTGPCSDAEGGDGGRFQQDIRPGQLAQATFQITNCPRSVRGDVVYNGNSGPHTNQKVPGVGYIDGVLVGTFSFTMR
jgi:hypothetical protein